MLTLRFDPALLFETSEASRDRARREVRHTSLEFLDARASPRPRLPIREPRQRLQHAHIGRRVKARGPRDALFDRGAVRHARPRVCLPKDFPDHRAERICTHLARRKKTRPFLSDSGPRDLAFEKRPLLYLDLGRHIARLTPPPRHGRRPGKQQCRVRGGASWVMLGVRAGKALSCYSVPRSLLSVRRGVSQVGRSRVPTPDRSTTSKFNASCSRLPTPY